METIALTDMNNDWRAIIADVQRTGVAVALVVDGRTCGILLPPPEAAHVVAHYNAQERRSAQTPSAQLLEELPTYLDLLRADPSLVPIVDGQPLEFLTMMNSSYVDPQQLYQFQHPRTHQIYVYRAGDLQQAIRRKFVRVDFIPLNPKAYVEGIGSIEHDA